MKRQIFMTATDTNAGKTFVATHLLRHYAGLGHSTLGLKPVASGCDLVNGQLQNADALALAHASTIQVPYLTTNPYAFLPAIAPHIAALHTTQTLSVASLTAHIQPGLAMHADITIIEGAGGWLLPLNYQETMADFVVMHQFEVILVVGMRLGCINHALLTERAIKQSGANLIGWVANCIDPDMPYLTDNIETLQNMLTSPLLHTCLHHPA